MMDIVSGIESFLGNGNGSHRSDVDKSQADEIVVSRGGEVERKLMFAALMPNLSE